VGAGQTLLVPRRDNATDTTVLPGDIGRPAVEPDEKTVRSVHVVHKGETLMAIARKFNLQVADIKRWNKLPGDTVQVGQKLALETTVLAPPVLQRAVVAGKAPAAKGRVVARGPMAKKARVATRTRGVVRVARR
jgi:LysM repeat protein